MNPLPMTVISGYLGAGKTTLINRLLTRNHGLRLMVMVNDFGAINIDAGLLASASEDTIALTNGCVCCTMGADLFMAIGDALDRRPRPDHLIIEASGIADPTKIATAAIAEPDLRYAGIVSVADGPALPALLADDLIGAQVRAQIVAADLIVISKCDAIDTCLAGTLAEFNKAPSLLASDAQGLSSLLLETQGDARVAGGQPAAHPDYTAWSYAGPARLDRLALKQVLASRPDGMFRLKGQVHSPSGAGTLVQITGKTISLEDLTESDTMQTQLVGIGPATAFAQNEADAWWQAAIAAGKATA